MSLKYFLSLLFALALLPLAHAADDSFHAPDSIVLKNGKVVKGLIIKNTRDAVVMEERFSENTYQKSDIVRILDESDVDLEYTHIERRGDLPAWRVIANDLRTHDIVKSLVEIPATAIDNGEFKNVPYMSFRVNDNVELDIYGDPEHPAAIELGIYGSKSGNKRLREDLRAYLAGFLTSREEVAALYSLPFTGGIKETKSLTFQISPKTAPDSYGAWWISIYNRKNLARYRLSDKEYARLTLPPEQVVDKKGRVIANGWTPKEENLSERVRKNKANDPVILRGFYRDKDGTFRLIEQPLAVRPHTDTMVN